MKLLSGILVFLLSMPSFAVCTGYGKIQTLWPRDGGWVHVKLEGLSNMDILNCGNSGNTGLLLNLNSTTSGTEEGKKMLYSTVLAAFMAGKELKLCSVKCDSQFPTHSALNHIDGLH